MVKLLNSDWLRGVLLIGTPIQLINQGSGQSTPHQNSVILIVMYIMTEVSLCRTVNLLTSGVTLIG
jgi:hypothetical protein